MSASFVESKRVPPLSSNAVIVKSRKRDIVIPRGQSVIVSCRAAIGSDSKIPILFELDTNHSWPSGLEIPETQVTVAGGSTCRANIRVDNPTKHDHVERKDNFRTPSASEVSHPS